MAITLTINGTTRQWQDGSLLIDETLNGQPRLSLRVFSADASWRPSLDQTIVVVDGSTTVFGGLIVQARESSPGDTINRNQTSIVTEITAVSYNVLASYRYVTASFSSQTLKVTLQALVDDYFSDDGVTLDAGQVNGPTLDAFPVDTTRGDEVLNKLSVMTQATTAGYVWEITYDKKLRMFLAGSEAAPVNITAANHYAIGDVIVEPKRGPYCNRVIVKAGTNVQVPKSQDFTGDGSSNAWPLTYPIAGPFAPVPTEDGAVAYGVINYADGTTESIGGLSAPAGFLWEYDPVAQTISRRAGAVANLVDFTFRYDVQFPITVIAEDAAEILAHGTREKLIAAPDVFDYDVALAIAEGELSRGITVYREVTYTTAQSGIRPGQTQTITFTARALNATCLVSQVRTRDVAGKLLHRNILAVEGTTVQASDRVVYKEWLAQGGGRRQS